MKGVTLHEPGLVRVEEVPVPDLLAPTDALVRVTLTAICGSDLHLYHGTIPGVEPGSVIGHEYAGVVEAVGAAVRSVRPGDRVTGSFHVACGSCPDCGTLRFHQCSSGGILGYGALFGNLAGTQAEYARIPYADVTLRRLPVGLTDEKALFAGDVLATAYGAVSNTNLMPGETVAVIGCGPVGLMAVQSAVALGAGRVLAIDLDESRLALAERFGAEPVVASRGDPVAAVNRMTGGAGADVVIEAVGGARTILLAFDLARGGGRIAAVGVTNEEQFPFPLTAALMKDLTFRIGMANVPRHIDAVIELVAEGRIDPSAVVSHRLPLSAAPEGYRLFDRREATKVLLFPGG
jgi:threonine dehydrogenase-like Zn-dependent dehydrogenase